MYEQISPQNAQSQHPSLEPTLQELTKALQMVGFEVNEQRISQQTLSDKIQQLLTAQKVMDILNNQPLNNS
jgi:hypothetical protein